MKIFLKILAGLFALLGGLFAVYYYNLDMKLMHSVIIPFLNKHYDARKIEHVIWGERHGRER